MIGRRVKFTRDFVYKPNAQQTYLYKAGDCVLVTREIEKKAVEGNYAIPTTLPVPPAGISETLKKFPAKRKRKIKQEQP